MVGGGRAARVIVLLRRGGAAEGRRAGLAEGEGHHLRVRRARAGEEVELRDGFGLVGLGRLVPAGSDWEVEIESLAPSPPATPLVLAVGAGDRDRFGWVVEKAVELGVTAVVPLETELTPGVASRLRAGGLDRLRRMGLEAVKQSGNPWACTVEEPTGLGEFLGRPAGAERWLADPDGRAPPASLEDDDCVILVGPEGGLTERERAEALGAGYRAVSLGPHILRLETAALAAAAAVQAARLRGRDG